MPTGACACPSAPGRHTVTATFIARTAALDEPARLPFERPYPAGVNIPETRTGAYLRAVEISGPYEHGATLGLQVAGDTASRQRIFSCRPGRRPRGDGRRCVRARDLEQARAARVSPPRRRRRRRAAARVLPRRRAEGFDAGIQLALKRLLVSPEFLFRVEQDPAGAAPGAVYAVSRSHARVAAVVLPLEQHPRRRAARGGRARRAARPADARAASAAHARRSRARRRSSKTSRGNGCTCATSTPSCPCRACSRISTTRCARA